ncbi:MAG: hypothetical protein KatS3mg119_1477 [Rhodothalassiaceae bacterium]|nr:MAG: hypothetical protein KatS3mg119_1477 [Rhodothalassiaceae bacterium]
MIPLSSAPPPDVPPADAPAGAMPRADREPDAPFSWLEDLPVAAAVIDGEGRVRALNARAGEDFGLRAGRSLLDRLAPAACRRVSDLLAGAEGRALVLRDEPVAGLAQSGVDIWIRRLDGAAAAVVLLDASPARQTARAESMLAAADRTAEGLVAALAHELRHPLASLKGAAQLLAGRAEGERDRRLAAVIEEEVARLDRLIAEVARFEAEEAAPAAVNLHEIIDHAVALTELRARNEGPPGLSILRDYDPSLPEIPGERDALIRLFLNLIENAREALAATACPRIRVSTRYRLGPRRQIGPGGPAELPAVEVVVADNGPGVAEDAGGDIFEAYVSDRGRRRGLGLAIAARIVRRHRGLIRYARADMGGAAFIVALPLAGEMRHE